MQRLQTINLNALIPTNPPHRPSRLHLPGPWPQRRAQRIQLGNDICGMFASKDLLGIPKKCFQKQSVCFGEVLFCSFFFVVCQSWFFPLIYSLCPLGSFFVLFHGLKGLKRGISVCHFVCCFLSWRDSIVFAVTILLWLWPFFFEAMFIIQEQEQGTLSSTKTRN